MRITTGVQVVTENISISSNMTKYYTGLKSIQNKART